MNLFDLFENDNGMEEDPNKHIVSCSSCGERFMRDRKEGYSHCEHHSDKEELDEKSSAKLGAKLGTKLVNRRQAHALTTKFKKPKLNFEEDDEEQNLDEILAPSQLAKLQSIRAQLPKAGGQKPSIPSDTDRADAEAWLNKLKNKDPVSAAKSGEDPLNFDRPGRPRQASYNEIQGKIQRLKSIKDLLKSIDKTEPRAMRSANKFGGADEISSKSQTMHDVVDNLNLNYTNEQELESIERRLSEYLQQLVAKSVAWKKPVKPSKHGAVTIIKPGEGGTLAEGTDDEIDADAGEMGTPEFRKALERLKQLANMSKPNDSTEKEQETKKKVNGNGSSPVTAHGYRYNQQDQRIAWTEEFASEAAAKEWARRRNATVLSIIPKKGVAEGAKVDRMISHIKSSEKKAGKSSKDAENIAWATANKRGYLDNKNKKKHVKEADDQSVFEATNRFTLYVNGNSQTHHATAEEARRFAETVKSKYPDAKIEIKQEMREEDMDTAAHNPSGAKFGGYYKGTQKGAPRAGQGFGSMEEGIAGNMTVRSDPLTKLKQHKTVKLRQADRFKGNPNRNNLVKAEAAKNATVTKPPMATKNPVAKFAQSVAKGAGKHQDNDFKSQVKGLDRKTKHKGKDKFGLGESPNFLTWAMSAGYNVIGNPKVYEDAKKVYNRLLTESKGDLKPGQYYLWQVNFDDGSSSRIKIKDEKFDVKAYYAKQNKVVVNIDYNWQVHG
jgi:hypothetical protein